MVSELTLIIDFKTVFAKQGKSSQYDTVMPMIYKALIMYCKKKKKQGILSHYAVWEEDQAFYILFQGEKETLVDFKEKYESGEDTDAKTFKFLNKMNKTYKNMIRWSDINEVKGENE